MTRDAKVVDRELDEVVGIIRTNGNHEGETPLAEDQLGKLSGPVDFVVAWHDEEGEHWRGSILPWKRPIPTSASPSRRATFALSIHHASLNLSCRWQKERDRHRIKIYYT